MTSHTSSESRPTAQTQPSVAVLNPMQHTLEHLLQQCTVRISRPDGEGYGSGFFVAPGLILTCNQVVAGASNQILTISWEGEPYLAVVASELADSGPDLVLLRLSSTIPIHPCVVLDESVQPDDFVYTYGFSDEFSEGISTTYEVEGLIGNPPFIKFKAGQAHPKLSGSPLLNWRTGKVCGIVNCSRDASQALGEGSIPSSVILAEFAELATQQQEFHQRDNRWRTSVHPIVANSQILVTSPGGVAVHTLTEAQQPEPSTLKPIFQVRPDQQILLDRQVERSSAIAALRNGRSVELFGPPGWGKTILLEALAADVQSTELFPDGVIYGRVGDRPLEDLLQWLANHLYESDPPIKLVAEDLRSALDNKQALIVLDDVQISADELKTLLTSLPRSAFLLATQESYGLEDLQSISLGSLPTTDALKLVERGMGRPILLAEQSAAHTLCSTLKGQPARILQCAAMVDEARSLTDIASQVQTEVIIRFLLTPLEEHQRLVVTCLTAFTRLALLPIQITALTGVADLDAVLPTLLQRRLIQTDGIRYRLADDLAQDLQQIELTAWQERILDYFTTWAEVHRDMPNHLLSEQDNLLTLMDWAITQDKWPQVLALSRCLEGALMVSGQWRAWEQVLQWEIQASQAVGDLNTEAWAMHQLGSRALCLGDSQTAKELLSWSLQRREALGDQTGAAVTRHNLSLLLPVVVPMGDRPETVETVSGRIPLWVGGVGLALVGALGLFGTVWFSRHRSTPTPSLPAVSPSVSPPVSLSPVPSFPPTVPTPTPTAVPGPSAPAANATLEFSDKRLPYGQIDALEGGKYRTLTVVNQGPDPIKLETIVLSGPDQKSFELMKLAESCQDGMVLQKPGDQCVVRVFLVPQRNGPHQAAIMIHHSGKGTPQQVPLEGRVVNAPKQPVAITEFSATPTEIQPGQSVKLCYGMTAAGKATLTPVGDIAIVRQECVDLKPQETTEYTLTVFGEEGSKQSRSVKVTVQKPGQAAQVLDFRVGQDGQGKAAKLCYSTANAVSATIEPDVGSLKLLPEGCVPIAPKQATTYTLVVNGPEGQQDTKAVSVPGEK